MGEAVTFEVSYTSTQDVQVFRAGALVHQGVFVEDVRSVPLLTVVTVLFHLPDLPPLQVSGRLVQSAGAGGYVALDGGDGLDALQAAVGLVASLSDVQALEEVVSDAGTEFAMDASSVEDGDESVKEDDSTSMEQAREMDENAQLPAEPNDEEADWQVLRQKKLEEGANENGEPTGLAVEDGGTDDGADENLLLEPELSEDPAVEEDGQSGRAEQISQAVTPVWQLVDVTGDTPIAHQVRALSLKDKLRLARQAARPVRQILIRDVEKNIHVQVVRNPKVSDQEILEFSAMAALSPLALRWIADQKRHVRNKRIAMNLVTNPSTPPDVAKKLLGGLSVSALRRVARSTRAKEPIRRAAKKKLMDAGEM